MSQTYQDIEIIIVDDGSTDNTQETTNADIVFCSFVRGDEGSDEIEKIPPDPGISSGFIKFEDLLPDNFCSTQTLLMKRVCFKDDIFNENLLSLVDWELMLRLIRKWTVYFDDKVLVRQYLQKDSISINYEDLIKSLLVIISIVRDEYKKYENSKWWKITYPGRAIFQKFKNIALGNISYKVVRNMRSAGFRNTSKKILKHMKGNSIQKLTTDDVSTLDGKVSVIVPTFNAGKEFHCLLDSLSEQDGLNELEFVIVDSGSADGTPEIAEKYGAKVIRILQSEFSHSYARNLGAKKASGKYLLFMTQDAKPSESFWILAMAQPLLHNNAVAVSCREKPRSDCDLLGAMNIWIHNNFMGITDSDRILKMPVKKDNDSIRKNAQLSDVACLIRKDIFNQFQYQGDYAEDLDLGIRLISAGYRLALLSNPPVIHSHNRPGWYYAKRCFVGTVAIHKLFPDSPFEAMDDQEAINRILTGYAAAKEYMNAVMKKTNNLPESNRAFFLWTHHFFKTLRHKYANITYKELNSLLNTDTKYHEEKLHMLMLRFYKQAENFYYPSVSIIVTIRRMLTHILAPYLNETYQITDNRCKENIRELVYKYFGQCVGTTLASYSIHNHNEKSYLNNCIAELRKGI